MAGPPTQLNAFMLMPQAVLTNAMSVLQQQLPPREP